MIEKVADNIYRIVINLPRTPLKRLNAYLIKGDRSLLVDTGFNEDSCYCELSDALDALNTDRNRLDIFITHLHADHAGLAYRLQRPGTKVYISETDFQFVDVNELKRMWEGFDETFRQNGFPERELSLLPEENVARSMAAPKNCEFTFARGDDILEYGERKLRCVASPGHTPGHLCLLDESEGICFLGDHILFDITPNVSRWPGVRDSLSDYLESLRRFDKLGIKAPLPGHREASTGVSGRIAQLIAHHESRLDETLAAIDSPGDRTAYGIASRMTWQIRAKDWDDFPVGQKWFATAEAMAHLDYLESHGKVSKRLEGGVYRYSNRS